MPYEFKSDASEPRQGVAGLAEDGDVVMKVFGKDLGVVGADYEEMGVSLQF